MPAPNAISNNFGEFTVRGEMDISGSAGAILAVRGDGLTATHPGTGVYNMVYKNSSAIKLVEILERDARYVGAGRPATALGVSFDTLVQNASTDDFEFVITTLLNPTSGAATNASAPVTIAFNFTIRTMRVSSPI